MTCSRPTRCIEDGTRSRPNASCLLLYQKPHSPTLLRSKHEKHFRKIVPFHVIETIEREQETKKRNKRVDAKTLTDQYVHHQNDGEEEEGNHQNLESHVVRIPKFGLNRIVPSTLIVAGSNRRLLDYQDLRLSCLSQKKSCSQKRDLPLTMKKYVADTA